MYLDYNASAPIIKTAKDKAITAMDIIGNPSSVHQSGRNAKYFIEEARSELANLVDVKKNDVIFTSGATEANNMALSREFDIFTTLIEHESVIEQSNINFVNLNNEGTICVEDLDLKLSEYKKEKKPIVSVMLVNNETGLIQPVKEVSKITRKHGAILHCDAVQALGRIEVNMRSIGCDMMTVSSHKIGGPKGSGALIVNSDFHMKSFIKGGGQERSLRSGTEALSCIAGFGAAAKHSRSIPLAVTSNLRFKLEKILRTLFPNITIIGENLNRVPNTSMISLPGIKSETLVIALDLEGIHLSAGSACSSGKVGPNRVLEAMGMKNSICESAIRISLGPYIKESDIILFTNTLELIYKRIMKIHFKG